MTRCIPFETKRVRFPINLYADESITGALARASREHVLARTKTLLTAAEIRKTHPGLVNLATPVELERLAAVLGCDASELAARAGTNVLEKGFLRPVLVSFGESQILPRKILGFEHRRIGPEALAKAEYHRLDWFNMMLSYCPETLEVLVQCCASCGANLSWHQTKGVGCCDFCGERIEPSREPPLPAEQAVAYRDFGCLTSLHAPRALAARARLAPELQSLRTAELITLITFLGRCAAKLPNGRLFTASAGTNKTAATAVVTRGTELVTNWPHAFIDWAANELKGVSASECNSHALWHELQRMKGDTAKQAFSASFEAQLAEALAKRSRSPGHVREIMTFNAVRTRLRMSNAQTVRLSEWQGLQRVDAPMVVGSAHVFDAAQIEELAPYFDGTVRAELVAKDLALPLYAIEAFCDAELLKWEAHPAFRQVKHGLYIRQKSVEALCAQLMDARRKGPVPAGAISLRKAATCIGGGLKPWARIFKALIEGGVSFWLDASPALLKNMLVDPQDLPPLCGLSDTKSDQGFDRSTTISQRDACEVLNITHTHFRHLIVNNALPKIENYLRTWAVEDLLTVAAEMVSGSELLGYSRGNNAKAHP